MATIVAPNNGEHAILRIAHASFRGPRLCARGGSPARAEGPALRARRSTTVHERDAVRTVRQPVMSRRSSDPASIGRWMSPSRRGASGAARGRRRCAPRARRRWTRGWTSRPGVPIGLPGDIPPPLLQLEWCAGFRGVVRDALHGSSTAVSSGWPTRWASAIARRWARVGVGSGPRRERAGPRRPGARPRLRPGRADRPVRGAPPRPAVRADAGASTRDHRAVRPGPARAGDERRRCVRGSRRPGTARHAVGVAGSCSSTTSRRPARRSPPAPTPWRPPGRWPSRPITVARER